MFNTDMKLRILFPDFLLISCMFIHDNASVLQWVQPRSLHAPHLVVLTVCEMKVIVSLAFESCKRYKFCHLLYFVLCRVLQIVRCCKTVLKRHHADS